MKKAAENSANKSNGRPTLGESVISEASLEYNDPPEQIWIRVKDAVKLIYSENPKRHDFSALIQSIEKYGYQEKAKYDSTLNAIKAGNGRIEALDMMEREGTYKLPRGLAKHKESGEWCVPLDIGTNAFDRNEALGYLIDANNLTMLGGDFGMYDIAKMRDEKNYANILKELQDFEIPTISMDQDDIGAFLNTIENGNKNSANDDEHAVELIDKAEELNKKWQVKLGDLWECGEHRVICGDSTHADVVSRLLGDDKPNLMVTDPPYGVEYDANWRNEKLGKSNRSIGKVKNDQKADWREAWSLFCGSVAYVWSSDKHSYETLKSLIECEFFIINQIVWAKTKFIISRGDYHSQHESCWYMVKKNSKHDYTGDRSQTTLWQIEHNKSETGHSTQKPLECMARPVRNNSAFGDLVYDPFLGSGTTLIACENLQRKCRGIEINPAYVAVTLQRWSDLTGQKPKRL